MLRYPPAETTCKAKSQSGASLMMDIQSIQLYVGTIINLIKKKNNII